MSIGKSVGSPNKKTRIPYFRTPTHLLSSSQTLYITSPFLLSLSPFSSSPYSLSICSFLTLSSHENTQYQVNFLLLPFFFVAKVYGLINYIFFTLNLFLSHSINVLHTSKEKSSRSNSFFFLFFFKNNCHCVFMKYKLSLREGNAFWVKDKLILNYVKFYLRLYIFYFL